MSLAFPNCSNAVELFLRDACLFKFQSFFVVYVHALKLQARGIDGCGDNILVVWSLSVIYSETSAFRQSKFHVDLHHKTLHQSLYQTDPQRMRSRH